MTISASIDDLCTSLAENQITRRTFVTRLGALGLSSGAIAAILASSDLASSTASAQDQPFAGETIRVQFWGGPEGEAIQQHVVDPFVQETGAEVIVEHGFTSDSIVKLQEQAASPTLDVVLMDDLGVLAVASDDVLQVLEMSAIPNAANVDDRFVLADGQGIGFFTYVDSLSFNTNAYPEPPASWSTLWSEQLRDKASVPPSSQTPALHLVIMAALLAGGDQFNPDPGFALLEDLRPNIRTFAEDYAGINELLANGEIDLVSWMTYVFRDAIAQGEPIASTLSLEEGVFATPGCAGIPSGHPGSQEVAEAFVNTCLDPAVQEALAEALWFGPTNREAVLPPEIAQQVITFDDLDSTIPVDLEHLLDVRHDWIARYDEVLGG